MSAKWKWKSPQEGSWVAHADGPGVTVRADVFLTYDLPSALPWIASVRMCKADGPCAPCLEHEAEFASAGAAKAYAKRFALAALAGDVPEWEAMLG